MGCYPVLLVNQLLATGAKTTEYEVCKLPEMSLTDQAIDQTNHRLRYHLGYKLVNLVLKWSYSHRINYLSAEN